MWKKFFRKIKGAISTVKKARVTTVAGAWVFYFLLAVIPLAFLLFTAFNIFKVDADFTFVKAFPEEFSTALNVVEQASKNVSKGVTVFFGITVIVSISSLLNQMSKDGAFIYGVERRRKKGISPRLLAVFALLVLFVMFIIVALIISFRNKLFNGLNSTKSSKMVVVFSAFIILVSVSYVFLMFLNKFISPVKLTFKEIATGSIISLMVMFLGTIVFIVYVKFFSTYNAFYGVLSGVIVMLLWSYILMLGIVMGVLVSMKMHSLRSS